MPFLSELQLNQFRNIPSAHLAPSPFVNIIYGDNGSGKTSLLEAISVIAHGRSFRTNKYRYLINKDVDEFTLFAKSISSSVQPEESTIGVQKDRKGVTHIRVNKEKVLSALPLARNLPLLTIDGHVFLLLEGGSKERRQFFDWLVFHVKHDFGHIWKEYTKCIKQRNSLLRHDKIDYAQVLPWDREIARLAVVIESSRKQCFSIFTGFLAQYLHACDFSDFEVSVEYKNGWKLTLGDAEFEECTILESLREHFPKDCALGYTNIGSHKSDLSISIDRKKSSDILSRGQQKVLICAMYLSLAATLKQEKDKNTVFLLDDLPAELDDYHLSLVGGWISELGLQTFISAVDDISVRAAWSFINVDNCSMFHVKHGEINQHNYKALIMGSN